MEARPPTARIHGPTAADVLDLEAAMSEFLGPRSKADRVPTPTRRRVFEVAGTTLMATAVLGTQSAASAAVAAEATLYERLGGVFAIAAVVDHFSDAVVKN